MPVIDSRNISDLCGATPNVPPPGRNNRPERLVVRFLGGDASERHKIDLTAWLGRRQIAFALRDYFESETRDKQAATRYAKLKKLNMFRAYLDERCPRAVSLGDLRSMVVGAYENWLDQRTGKRQSGGGEEQGLGELTKASTFAELVQFLSFCLETPHLALHMDPDLRVRRNPWPQAFRGVKSREVLSRADLQKVRQACLVDVAMTKQRLAFGASVRADSSIVVPPLGERSASGFRSLPVKLRSLIERKHDRRLRHPEIKEVDQGLARSLVPDYGTVSEAASYLHFTSDGIVAFVLLLAMETMFNPDTVLGLRWDDIVREHPIFGPDRWQILGEKPRAGRRQTRSISARAADDGAAVQVLKALEEFGASAREAAPGLREYVFLHWQVRGAPFCAFRDADGGSGSGNWKRALEQFRVRHGLPQFSLVNLRATAADILDDVVGGDLKAKQEMLGHASLTTTERHYHSGKAKLLGREALATEIDLRERYAATGGRADPRNGDVPSIGRSAATPGFRCVDPDFSPIPGQKAGRPCNAYGACPTCPLAFVDLDSHRSYGRLVQFRDRIRQAQTEIDSERFVEVWQPRLDSLERDWLARFPAATVEASKTLDLSLPPRIE